MLELPCKPSVHVQAQDHYQWRKNLNPTSYSSRSPCKAILTPPRPRQAHRYHHRRRRHLLYLRLRPPPHVLLHPNSDKRLQRWPHYLPPFSDGFDEEGYGRGFLDVKEYRSIFRTNSKRNVSILINELIAGGRPVTCMVHTIFLNCVLDIAGELGIPSVLYWIQATSVFVTYYHFFHGFESLIKAYIDDLSFTVCFPGLQPLQIRDLPSLVRTINSDSLDGALLCLFRELFEFLDEKARGDEAYKKKYMEWLDKKEEGSVVYISFGSLSMMNKEQMEEIVKGLKESKRPYLLVVRKDNKEKELLEIDEGGDGMVVEWCSQVRVLAHKAVGCFVTHCGWNSTLESLAFGVPMVCLPQWSDQAMNAKLVESLWGCGVKSAVDGDGVVKGEELVKCLELVMGDEDKGVEIRTKAKIWKDKASEAVSEGGSSSLNLNNFLRKIS
ncbi:crocetin glucosyltransferase, chloroplastic-like [Dioscorea cayenensis subsp. rotundata]|uniref:Glycosyltransferase n=1 Tax=Dioscorea cayennensis subsp. rotundata TaxID=55577 RepID=A0AB40D1D8_DIOCR|nr:crocetin glucosyltransferase, chloroplastic-like [Dioscorea cayenensis subsp. rotundata]